MIDVHCHYLPDVDDGPRSLQESIALLRLCAGDGTEKAILTPHVFAGRWPNTLSTLRPRFDAFRALVQSKGIAVELFLGGEVRLQPEMVDLVAREEIPYLGGWDGYKVMLLEFEDGRIPAGAINAVRHLLRRGILPMLAHPERNRGVMANHRLIEPFVAEGCLLQLTAASVIGDFGSRCQSTAHRLLDAGWVTMVASDAHNVAHRPPLMSEARLALVERYGSDMAEALTQAAPARLLEGRAALGI